MIEQSKYIIEHIGENKKQISRFAADGNRIVTIRVECAAPTNELLFIVDALNFQLIDSEKRHTTIEPKH